MPPVVVVRPLSGYINRLQAIVSGALLAEDLGSHLWVCWEPSDVAPVPAQAVLGSAWCAAHLREPEAVEDEFGVNPTSVDPYLNVGVDGAVITLAGLDRGEQHFMPEVRSRLQHQTRTQAVIISAGGKFTLQGDGTLSDKQAREFRSRRVAAYAELPLHPDIELLATASSPSTPFLGLHLRYSDRSIESPWRRRIAPALEQVSGETGVRSIFIASDTSGERDRWTSRVAKLGLEPWSAQPGDYPREDPRSARGALADWRILTRSRGMVYFAASSFAEEAAVASGHFDISVGLQAGSARRAFMRGRQYWQAARTYRQRHSAPAD